MRQSLIELSASCRVLHGVYVGGFYRHYGNAEVYEVVLISMDEETGRPLISYRKADQRAAEVTRTHGCVHTRLLDVFLEEVIIPPDAEYGVPETSAARFKNVRPVVTYADA